MIIVMIIIIIIVMIIIIITRPKPPSGRQGLAVSWGKDTVRQVHYKMFSTSHFAPTALSSNWILLFKCGYKNSLVITKIPPGTVQNHENPPVNTINPPTLYFLLSAFYLLPFTFYFLLSTFYFLLSTFYFLLTKSLPMSQRLDQVYF